LQNSETVVQGGSPGRLYFPPSSITNDPFDKPHEITAAIGRGGPVVGYAGALVSGAIGLAVSHQGLAGEVGATIVRSAALHPGGRPLSPIWPKWAWSLLEWAWNLLGEQAIFLLHRER
jgi:hypothetical protein